MNLPSKKYSIIYADPPWQYKRKHKNASLYVNNQYDLMSHRELLDLPVQEIAEKDCLLFMWATSPLLNEAIPVGEAWGFQYSTVAFVWHKMNSVAGSYTMSNCEICLVFRTGKIPSPRGARNIQQYVQGRTGKHSRKPNEVRDRITQMFPTQSKIELFARRQSTNMFGENPQDGWDTWGLES